MGYRKSIMKRLKQGIIAKFERENLHLDIIIIILLFTITISLIFWLIVVVEDADEYEIEESPRTEDSKRNECPCTNVLGYGTKGSWVKEISPDRQMETYNDSEIRKKLGLPLHMYREDVRCGINYPFGDTALPSACNPESIHFCCNEETSWCGNTTAHCTKAKSVNYREFVGNDKAVWKQDENICKLEDFSRKEACKILSDNSFNLVFIGDSNARKFLASFLLCLTENFSHGLLSNTISSKSKLQCNGELQILDPYCRHVIHDSSILLDDNEACDLDNEFLLEYFADFNTFVTRRTEERIKSLYNISNTYIILNAGAHFNSNKDSFINYYLKFISNLLKNVNWPKIIVESLPRVPTLAINEKRIFFRDQVKKFCLDKKLLFFDNYELSKNLLPYDGKNFRLKYFFLKVKILLNFLKKNAEIC